MRINIASRLSFHFENMKRERQRMIDMWRSAEAITYGGNKPSVGKMIDNPKCKIRTTSRTKCWLAEGNNKRIPTSVCVAPSCRRGDLMKRVAQLSWSAAQPEVGRTPGVSKVTAWGGVWGISTHCVL